MRCKTIIRHNSQVLNLFLMEIVILIIQMPKLINKLNSKMGKIQLILIIKLTIIDHNYLLCKKAKHPNRFIKRKLNRKKNKKE